MESQQRDVAAIRAMVVKHKRADGLFAWLGLAAIVISLIILVVLFAGLIRDGWTYLSWDFFSSHMSSRPARAGVLAALVGSICVMVVTVSAAVPLGVAAGVYLEEYARKNWLTALIEINVTNLASVPSVIFGILGLSVFVQFFGMGPSILSAGLTLALLILPVIIVATREAIRAIPVGIREAVYGLGATKWQVVSGHVLPYSVPGILTGIIVGMARAVGETAPLLLVGAVVFITFLPASPIHAGFPYISFEWVHSSFTVLPRLMFQWTSESKEAFHLKAAAVGLVLIALTVLMNGLAIYLRYKLRKNLKW